MSEVNLAGVTLRNPTILASGIMGTTASSLKRIYGEGAGAVTTKSIGPEEREGHKNPTVLEIEEGILNAVGLSCASPEESHEEFKGIDVPTIVSVYGNTSEDYANLAGKFQEIGIAIELNVSCPQYWKSMPAGDAEFLGNMVEKVKQKVEKPLFVKLSPNVQDIGEIAKAVEKGGADGITAINTVGPGMIIDLKTKKPVLGYEKGGISGSLVKPIAVRCVYEIYEAVKIPIIGVGGVSSWKDAIEMIMAGAGAVGIGSGVAKAGLGVFREVDKGIDEYLKKEKTTLEELRGVAHGRD